MGLLTNDFPPDQQDVGGGLLGRGFNDPRSAAVMGLAAGLVRGDYGGGLLAANAGYQDAQDSILKRADVAQQIQLRNLQARQAQLNMNLLQRALGGTGFFPPSDPSAPTTGTPSTGFGVGNAVGDGSVPTQGSAPASAAPSGPNRGGSFITGLTPDQLAMFKLSGHDLTDVYKLATDPLQLSPGSVNVNRFTGAVTTVPSMSQDGKSSQLIPDPTAPGGFRVAAPEGAVDTYNQFVTTAKRAENANTPLPLGYVDRRTGRPMGGTVGAYIDSTTPLPVNQGNLPLTPELASAIRQDALRNGISNPQVNLNLDPGTVRNPQIGIAKPPASAAGVGGPRIVAGAAPATTHSDASGGLQSAAEAAAATTGATKAAESAQAYKDALDSKVEEEFQLVNRNKQIVPLLDKFQSGGIAPETRLQIGNAIANTGILPDGLKTTLSTWIANGDPTAGKVLQNQLASAGILTMLQTLDKEGKPNRAIFQAVQKAQEGLESGNTTLKDVFELQHRLYDIHYNEQQALTKAIKDGSYDPRTWAGDYSAIRNSQLNQPAAPLPSAATPGGNGGAAAADLPKNPTATNLVRGQVYRLPNGKTAVWNGMVFRSN
jgi:hypothetical protein